MTGAPTDIDTRETPSTRTTLTVGRDADGGTTRFGPPERLDDASVRDQSRAVYQSGIGSTLETFPEFALVLNTHRQIVAANTALADFVGVGSSDRLIGARFGEAIGCVHAGREPNGCGTAEPCSVCGVMRAILRALDRSGRRARDECRITIADGDDRTSLDLGVTITPLDIACERFLVVAAQDIAARKRRQALERLFFHDTLNLAGGIQGYAALLAERDTDGSLPFAAELTHLAADLIEQISSQRDLATAERGELIVQPERVEAGPLLDRVAGALAAHPVGRDKHIETRSDLPRGAAVCVDPRLLKRVLVNLCKNAVEASDRGATIRVAAGPGEDRSRAVFSVWNAGVMPRAARLQAFQRSFSTKGGSGRGLGLFSVRLFTERYLRGRVWFESDDGSGTTFSVELPLAEAAPPVSGEPDPAGEGAERRAGPLDGVPILLADDSLPNRRLAVTLLRRGGAHVDEADCGSAAIEAARIAADAGEPHRCVLLDIDMPDLNGYEVAETIRSLGYRGPMFALTASCERGPLIRGAGFEGMIPKPIAPAHFAEQIARLIRPA